MDEDLSGTFIIPYSKNDPSAGSFTYSYRFPHISESNPDAACVNSFFVDQVDMLETNVRFMADGYADVGISVTIDVEYKVTCNNDQYFSALIFRRNTVDGNIRTVWQGTTFSRSDTGYDGTFDLPRLMGILDIGEQDETLQSRQSERAARIVRMLILDMIKDNRDHVPYYDLTYEDLEYLIYPDEDFYLDETGEPVFFIDPGSIADESLGYMTFRIPLDDILDEL